MRAAKSNGMSTGPMATAVLVWLIMGTSTKKPTSTAPGNTKKRTFSSGFTNKCTRC